MPLRQGPAGLGGIGRAWAAAVVGAVAWAGAPPAEGQAPNAPSTRAPGAATTEPADEANERRAAERFLGLLERSPRRGTALDRAYGYHVERGTLDGLIQSYRDRAAKDPKDGASWMIVGLLESQRGRDAAAVAAFRSAESARPDDPIASYYLGQSLSLVGDNDGSAAALERAIDRKPRRADLLEIFQALGRVYQRAQKPDRALAVWNRLETLFPADLRVQEQAAAALAEEGQLDPALARYEALAKKASDPFRQVELAAQAADLKARLGRSDQALRDYETILGRLRPDSWLFREVRRKVEDVFLRNDDQAGLAAYYEGWVGRNPEDVEAHVRLARTLQNLGRAADARRWYDKAITLAPTRRDLRLALVALFEQEGKFDDAAAQYAALDKADPNNPDTLRDWGGLLLRDSSKPEGARAPAAQAVWKRLLDARPNDPVTVAQVADLDRQAGLVDDAIALYRRASALAPGNPQYVEYLGEYLHTLKRPDEAQAAWAKIAEGANRTPKNLARLGEALAGFGYARQAVEPTRQAVALEGDDFALRLKFADLLFKVEQYDEALAQLAEAGKLAEKDEEKAAVLDAELKNDQAAGRITEKAAALARQADAGPGATTSGRIKVARYLEADGKLPEALRVARAAVEADPRSVPAWTLIARLHEANGDLLASADASRRLAEVDRKNRTGYLTEVAKLEARLGRSEEALKAGRDLIAAAPSNPEGYQFFADLCFQLNRQDEGLDALRRAARVNPNDTKVVLTLAENLAGQFRTDEAIEMFWRAFDKADGLDAKLGVIPRLADLYLQVNQFDRLLARLRRQDEAGAPPTPQQQRERAICLAQAYASSGDIGAARSELERLLAANARDVQLLQQLSKLAEDEGDLESAARFQRQLAEVAPGDEQVARLAQLLARGGEIEEAQALWSKQAAAQSDPAKVLATIDSLLGSDRVRPALETAEALVRKDPHDWEALYRAGVALATLDDREGAAARFRAILDQRADDDAPAAQVRARARDPKLQGSGARASAFAPQSQADPLTLRAAAVLAIRSAARIEVRAVVSSAQGGARTTWAPADFGQARLAALGWLFGLALKEGDGRDKALADHYRAEAEKPGAPARAVWDWYYLSLVRSDSKAAYEAARVLGRAPQADASAIAAYLRSLATRTNPVGVRTAGTARLGEAADQTPPLPSTEIDEVLAAFESLSKRRPDLINAVIVNAVDIELRRAKRDVDRDRFYRQLVERAELPASLVAAVYLASLRPDVGAMLALSDRFERASAGARAAGQSPVNLSSYFAQAIAKLGEAKDYPGVLRILDHSLAGARRRREEAQATTRGRSRASMASTVNQFSSYVTVYSGGMATSSRSVALSFPTVDSYLDSVALTLLRNAYEVYKRADLASDLVAHVRQFAEGAKTPDDAICPRMALAALLWWEEDKDGALAEYARAVEAARSDPELVLKLAELHQQRGEPAEALALLDSVQPSDNATLQAREEAALRLAIQTGQVDRARAAAERLFGLRLDAESQLRLSEQMHQLGMHEPAEALLARSRRRAGNKATALVGLMQQYQRQDKGDIAAQVALQILRSSTPTRQANSNVVNADAPDAARSAALQVLARSGRLDDLIRRTEEQVRRVPGSAQLRLTLADYLLAANKRDQARDELKRLAEARPDDVQLRLRVATALAQQGQAAEAIPHFEAVLKKEPALLSRNLNVILSAYRRANRTDELLALLEQADLRAFGQSSQVLNLIQNIQPNNGSDSRGIALFRKVWEAFPAERANMFQFIQNDEFWQSPEIYTYAVQSFLPDLDAGSYIPGAQWNLFGQILAYSANGVPTSTVSRILDMAAAQGKLGDLAGRVEALLKRIPDWTAGRAMLALIRCREGRFGEAREGLKPILAIKPVDLGSNYPDWIIGGELDKSNETRDLATTFYERSVSNRSGNGWVGEGGPMIRLLEIYTREGRKEDARRVLLESTRPSDRSNVIYQPDYEAQMRIQTLTSAGSKLIDLGYVADAAPLFGEAAEVAEGVSTSGPNYVGNLDQLLQQARTGLDGSLGRLKGSDLATLLSGLVDSPGAGGQRPGDDPARPGPRRRPDFAMTVLPRELDRATVRSVYADAVARLANDPKALGDFASKVEALASARPDEVAAQVASTLGALALGDRAKAEAALDRLDRAVAACPLEALPPGTAANARQRAEAAAQMPLWFVARVCAARSDDEPYQRRVGPYFARAKDAARRQTEDRWILAMLREEGQQANDRGDRAGAEAAWSQMLDRVLSPEPRGRVAPTPAGPASLVPAAQPTPMPVPAAPPSPMPAPAAGGVARPISYQAPARPAPGAAPGGPEAGRVAPAPRASGRGPGRGEPSVPVLTVDRFERAMQIARLAAAEGQPELSFRAVREALRGGPPVEVAPQSAATKRATIIRAGAAAAPADTITPQVVECLVGLDALWLAKEVPPARVYETLRDVVLPASRPTEVFLYASGFDRNGLQARPRSVGALAASWAARAGKLDELRAGALARKTSPSAELPASVLVALIGLAARDDAATDSALKALLERARRDTLRSSAELICHAALPALDRAATQGSAVELIEAATRGFEGSTARALGLNDPSNSLSLVLARQAFRRGDLDAGRKRLAAFAEASDRQVASIAGDYTLFLRKTTLATVAAEYARAGLADDLLRTLGEFADAPAYSGGDPPLGPSVPALASLLSSRPAPERFEALRKWTLPTGSRRLVRLMGGMATAEAPPAEFRADRSGLAPLSKPGPQDTASLLIDAARETGTLDRLAADLAPLVEAKEPVENARELAWLVALARGQGESVRAPFAARLDEIEKAPTPNPGGSIADRRAAGPAILARGAGSPEYLVAHALIGQESPPLRALGQRAYRLLMRQPMADYALAVQLKVELAASLARDSGLPTGLGALDGGLAGWHPAASPALAEAIPQAWVAHQGHVSNTWGTPQNTLYYDIPLGGTYEFSVDIMGWGVGLGSIVHGGTTVADPTRAGQGRILRQSAADPAGPGSPEGYSRLTVRAEPGVVRYLADGRLLLEDKDPSPTSPWVGLVGLGLDPAVWKNATLTGSPTVPREVPLSVDDRLDGWDAGLFNESRGPRVAGRPMGPATIRLPGLAPSENIDPENFDWIARDGVISGRKVAAAARRNTVPVGGAGALLAGVTNPSRIAYTRPLRDGDEVSYEFLYEPGRVEVHPSIGRLVFLLERPGVRLRWLTTSVDAAIGLDDSVEVPAGRVGDAPLPLKPSAWNTASLSLQGEEVVVRLNGQEVARRRLGPTEARHFGLYHDKAATAAKARRVVLRGGWPNSLAPEQRADIFATRAGADLSDAARRTRHGLVGEDAYAGEAGDVLGRVAGLDPAGRYAALADWVLPTPDHPAPRLAGTFTPSDAPALAGSGPSRARVETGGELRAPALALVEAARESGRLDDLEARLATPASGDAERGRVALAGLVRLAQGDGAGASAALDALGASADSADPAPPDWRRWPDFVLASAASAHPDARAAAARRLDAVIEGLGRPGGERPESSRFWEVQVRHARATARLASGPSGAVAAIGSDPDPLPNWSAVSHMGAADRGRGFPTAGWSWRDSVLTHQPGRGSDFLFFNVPLRGDFRLDCEILLTANAPVQLAYGGLAVGLLSPSASERTRFGQPGERRPVNPPVGPGADGWVPARLEVAGGRLTVTAGGRGLYDGPLPVDHDPWLALRSLARGEGSVRKLAIAGRPTVPEILDLASGDLAGWSASEYPGSPGTEAPWQKRGSEIVARAEAEQATSTAPEGLLRYHRPIREDGEVSYEFYQGSGPVPVAPALGLVAFLLKPEGVAIRRLADATENRSGGSVGPGAGQGADPLPLRRDAWNAVKLAVRGDTVIINLNDRVVAERPIEANDPRTFGFYRPVGLPEVRVRNVKYRGSWPREVTGLAADPAPAGR